MEFLSDWQVGHDEAKCNGGERKSQNVAPVHGSCNRDQHKRTFAQFAADLGVVYDREKAMNADDAAEKASDILHGYRSGKGKWVQ